MMLMTRQHNETKGWWDKRQHRWLKNLPRETSNLPATDPPERGLKIYSSDAENEHLLLAKKRICYLLLDEFSDDLFDMARIENRQLVPFINDDVLVTWFIQDEASFEIEVCKSLATYYDFFDYAASNWARHFAACNKIAPLELIHAAMAISKRNTHRFKNWFRYYWTVMDLHQPFPRDFDSFLIACYFGHASSLAIMWRQGFLSQDSIMSGLFWASKMGQLEIIRILIWANVQIDRSLVGYQNPLVTSAELGNIEIVRLLLQRDIFDVNSSGRAGRTSLSMASGCGHTKVVDLLLAHQHILPNQSDVSKWTPLIWAVGSNQIDIVRRLLADERVNINQVDNTGKSALIWAAAEGLVEIVKLLLAQRQVEVDKQDQAGRTALSWAAGNGQLETLRLLIKSERVNVSARDQHGRNAISWSCAGGYHEVLNYLLVHDKTGADIEDEDGWTPLIWAVESPSLEAVKMLLLPGLVDTHHEDRRGRNAIMWAAAKGNNGILGALTNIQHFEVLKSQ